MKSFVSTSTSTITMSIAFLVAISLISFLPLNQSKTLINHTNTNTDLIMQTCKRTPNYTLCVSTLRSNPRSSGANLQGLTLIMVGVVNTKVKETLKRIDGLLNNYGSMPQHNALSFCGDNYKAILKGDVPEAIEAITSGDYKFAEQGMSDAANEVGFCESMFSAGNSPLTDLNKAAHDVANVAASMARMLMVS